MKKIPRCKVLIIVFIFLLAVTVGFILFKNKIFTDTNKDDNVNNEPNESSVSITTNEEKSSNTRPYTFLPENENIKILEEEIGEGLHHITLQFSESYYEMFLNELAEIGFYELDPDLKENIVSVNRFDLPMDKMDHILALTATFEYFSAALPKIFITSPEYGIVTVYYISNLGVDALDIGELLFVCRY